MEVIRFTIPGVPRPKERPRKGKGGRWYTPDRTAHYEHAVAAHWLAASAGRWRRGYTGPVSLVVRAFFPDWRTTDIDNVAKAISDALNGGPYIDDRQVCELHAFKDHDPERPRVEVEISKITKGQVG